MSTNNSGSGARRPQGSRSTSSQKATGSRQPVTASKSAGSEPQGGARSGDARRRPGQQGNRQLVRPAPRSKVRRAHLTVAKVDLWSVAKLVFLLSVAVGIVAVVAAIILWLVFDVTGIFKGLNDILSMLSSSGNAISITDYLSLGQVALYTTILSVLNVVLLTILGIIAAFLYNIAAKLVGGVGVTLTDD